MSVKKIDEIKSDRGFKVRDLFIYGAIFLLALVIFITAFATADKSPLSGVRVYVRDDVVFEYGFENGRYKVYDTDSVSVANSGDALEVTVNCGGGFNRIKLYKSGRVSVTEADCYSQTCVKTPDITDSSSFIFCSPHRLRVVPYNFSAGQEVPIG